MSRSVISNKHGVWTADIFGKNKPSGLSCDTISSNLWVGNLAADVSDSDLMNLFGKHGGVESVICYPSRNYAFVYLKRADDAKRAMDNLQGVRLRGNPLKIGFAKPKILPSEGRNGGEERPSNILLISYPPAVHIDEQMLHNAMILFGEIEKIKSFPPRYCSFVEFRSVEEAQLAKEGLQGKLFSDSRISITFSPYHFYTGFRSGTRGIRPDEQLDIIGQPIVPNSFHRLVTPRGVGGPDNSIRPFAPLSSFGSTHPGPDFSVSDPNPIKPIGGYNWMHSPSPSNPILSPPSARMNPCTKPTPETWHNFDACQIQREPKRLKTDGSMPLKEMNDRALLTDQIYRGVLQVKGVVPSNTRFTNGSPDVDYMWRGIIAKGGAPVCHAHCVPVGDWIGYKIPKIVNCTARTGLDMLAKHCANAVGFDIIFFLPDSQEDFASYTELLRYLGDRNRAGVAKFDDGTSLFLVPPSEFLTKVLKVSGPARLYGVVLKFPQHASDSSSGGPAISPPQYIDNLHIPTQNKHPILHPHSAYPSGTVKNSHIQDLSFDLPSHEVAVSMTSSRSQNVTWHGVSEVNVVTSSSQVHGTNVYEPESIVPEQMQQLQSSSNGANQKTLESDADRNERYQSTLQLAASLLFQIHQKRAATGVTDGNH